MVRFSIVTPSFNQDGYIRRTIDSVLCQNYPKLEYIVVDGGSTDSTVKILKKYGNKIKWISEKDNGQSHAINKGMKMSTGDILAYLNSDDTYEPGVCEKVVEYFDKHPKTMIVYGKGKHIDKNSLYINDYPTEAANREVLKVKCPICQPSVFWRRELWDKVGKFDETLKYGMDYDYWIRVSKKYKFGFIDKYLANTRLHEGAKTISQKQEFSKELVKINKKHFGDVNDEWILAMDGEILSGICRSAYLKKLILKSFIDIWKLNRRLPRLKTWRYYIIWVRELLTFSLNKS